MGPRSTAADVDRREHLVAIGRAVLDAAVAHVTTRPAVAGQGNDPLNRWMVKQRSISVIDRHHGGSVHAAGLGLLFGAVTLIHPLQFMDQPEKISRSRRKTDEHMDTEHRDTERLLRGLWQTRAALSDAMDAIAAAVGADAAGQARQRPVDASAEVVGPAPRHATSVDHPRVGGLARGPPGGTRARSTSGARPASPPSRAG